MHDLIQGLKAAGEPTRLRILAILARTELTVSELCQVLSQTQPRVSRHLRLLCEAGLLDRNAQGTSAFYRPARSGPGRPLFDAILPLINADEEALRKDLTRLAAVRAERAAAASEYFERIANDWDQMRALHVSDSEVEGAMMSSVQDLKVRDLLDVGTGTGRVLELFADRIDHGLGVDLSHQMLDLARSRLDDLGYRNCAVRHGNVYDLAVDAGSMDVAVLHHVLHYLDDPASAISEVARTIRPQGRLVIVDFASHEFEDLRTDYAHYWLGFTDDEVKSWCEEAGLCNVTVTHLTHKSDSTQDTLTVTLWSATQSADSPAVYKLEAAS